MMKHTVAVYGTLRKGEPNHRLLERSRYLTKMGLPGFRMHHLGGFPAIVADPESTQPITVELYEVDTITLKNLDQLEGYNAYQDSGMYLRDKVAIAGGGVAYIYHMSHDKETVDDYYDVISTGDWCAQ